MKNPHLRAKLAEVLEAVMPHLEPVSPGLTQPIMFQRHRVFCEYSHAANLAEALITVFVDIEFTGKQEQGGCVCVCVCVCMYVSMCVCMYTCTCVQEKVVAAFVVGITCVFTKQSKAVSSTVQCNCYLDLSTV